MKKIVSNSKMRESMQLKDKKYVVFEKGSEVFLKKSDYDFLYDQDGGPFKYFVDNGIFFVNDEEEKKPSKKEQKKIEKAKQAEAEKKTAEQVKTAKGE